MKNPLLIGLLLISGTLHAQQRPGVNCAPVQGNGWQGCAPISQSAQAQQPQNQKPPIQIWIDHYGAIATDFPHGSVGIANDLQDQLSAEQAAIAACQAKGGITCNIEITYRNQCAGLVAGDTGHNTKSGATVAEAIQKAMQVCAASDTNCRAFYTYTGCSLPARVQ